MYIEVRGGEWGYLPHPPDPPHPTTPIVVSHNMTFMPHNMIVESKTWRNACHFCFILE